MKKYSLTLILVLCLFVITGGTYAAWTYYEGKIENTTGTLAGTTIVGKVDNQTKGTLEVTGDNLVTIEIKDDGSNNTVLDVKNDVTVTFTGNGNIEGTTFSYELSLAGGTNSFKGGAIFEPIAAQTLTFNGTASDSTATITANQLATAMGFNSHNLATVAEHDTYANCLTGMTFTLTIKDTTVYPA